MASEVVCGLIFRVLLPVCLAAACLFRYNGLSFIYLLYLLLIPLFPEPSSITMQGYTGHLLKSLCFCSMTFLFIHIVYQITIHSLLAANSIDSAFNCSVWEKSIRQIGFESVIGADAGNGIRVFLPDIGMFMASLSVWLLCRKLVHKRPSEEMAQDNHDFEPEEKMKILRRVAGVATKLKEIIGNLITTAGQVVVTVLLGLTGVTLPSLSSAVYFFVFLGLCTWWSLCKTFDKLLFSCLCVLMAIFSAGHLILLYSNQFQFLQEAISLNDSYTSLFGISSIVRTDCSSTWKLAVNSGLNWHHFVNPIMLLVLYYTLATLIRLWLQDPMIMVVVVNSNGTSFDYVSAVPIENGPVSLDIYSTPQYKVDQPVEFEEKTDENTNEILDSQLEEEEEKTDVEEEEEEEEEGGPSGALVKVFKFVMKQSYICALIAMMAWSITYVSWLTFVFLLWSCTLWMVRDRRKYAMMTSPFMVAYGNLLLVLQYIWCFERLDPVPGFFLKMEVPFTELSTKVLCQLSFWLLLRQTLMERQEKMEEEAALCDVKVDGQKKEEEKDKEEEEGDENDLMHVIGKLVMAMLVKYWIYVCGGMFFFVSFEGKMVMYKIIYMMMFLSCVALYQVHYEWWRRILKYFWMSVVVYTMLVLILIYTCQFENAISTWTNMTGMSKDVLRDIGLEKYVLSDLFTRIFIPTSFLLVCILHLHYFHDRFLQLTDLKAVISKEESTIYRLAHPDGSLADLTMMSTSPEPLLKEEKEKEKESMNEVALVVDCVDEEKKKESLSIHSAHLSSQEDIQQFSATTDPELPSEQSSDLRNKWHLVVDRLTVLFLKFLESFHKLKLFVWWLLEMHIIKIVSTYIILLSVKEVSLLNYVFLISWAFALPYKQFRVLASSACTIWTCVIIVCKLFYQLETIEPENYSSNCTKPSNYSQDQKMYMNNSLLYWKPVDPANWVGLEKFKDILPNLRNNLLMLAILAFEVTVYRHQEFFRLRNKLSPPPSRTIFHDITRQHLDNGIIDCAKYFINYFFYKFGLEVCFLLAINVMGQRMDFYSMLHGLALAVVMYRRRRKAIAEIWPKYCCFLACMITFQYLICIGIPPAACKDYPWRFPGAMLDSDVIKWLYLPDFHTQPNSMFLVYDFMLLLCASLQRQVFDDENKAAVRLMAGDNVEICRDLDAASFSVHNPVPDFIHCRSYLDMLKVIMFSYLFWFVLTIIFITGTTRISIFCMGYLVACFYFLLFGGNLLLKPIKKILRYWDFLIAYNLFVITMKNVFAILACGYIKHLVKNSCWLVQLLSLACTIKEYKALEGVSINGCEVPKDEAGIIWDSICFTFLLLQRRVFMSYYFLHVVADIRAGQILASRGAELFQASIVKAVRARLEEEKRSMEQLKRQKCSTESIKKQKKYLKLMFVYHTWIAESKAALKERGKGRRHFWKRYGRRRKKDKKEGHVAIEIGEEDRQSSEEDKTDGPDNIFKRVFNIIKFTWVLFLTTVESITKWLNSVCREYIDISTVLRIERCMLTREVKKGNVPSRESIHVYYQKQMKLNGSRESGLDRISEEDSCSNRERRRRAGHSLDSFASRDSISSAYTEATMLFSRQSTLDDLDDMPQNIPKTSERARPKLRKMYGLDMSNSSADSGSSVMSSEATQCVTLFSRQGTNDTIDEVEDEKEQVEVKKKETAEIVEDTPEGTDHEEIKEEEVKQEATIELPEEVTPEVTDELAEEETREVTDDPAEEATEEVEEEIQWDLVDPEEAVEDVQVPQLEFEEHQEEAQCITEDEEGEQPIRQDEGESSEPENVQTDVVSGQLFTPDTDAPNTSDADVPPSYSKAVSFDRLSVSSDESDSDKRLMLMTPDSKSDLDDPLLPSMTTDLTASELLLNKMFYDEELENSDRFYKSQPLGLQLCYALYNLLVAHSEMVCYLVIILNHMISANMATLVLPILIFLWAMLSVPRPSKRFWMTAIVYTEVRVTIVIKYFFQFSFFPFNQNVEVSKGKPYHPPNIIGTEKKEGYVHYDLVQLLALFFHRSILKCHGLWDEDDPKTSRKDECLHQDESVDEGKMSVSIPSEEDRKSSPAYSLKSVNLGMSVDTSQVHVQMRYPEHRPYLQRQSTSGSYLSHRSSVRSKRGSTSTRNSIRRENSTTEPEVPQKSRKDMIMEKIREQLIKVKVYVIKKLVEFYQPIHQFFYNLIHPEYNAVTDVYVLMFLADTVDFIIIVFGFWAFGKHQGGADITSSLSEDQVPGPFLVMVLIQFGTMVVDRALYLRKTVMGKLIFQVILVFGIHFWMFFILPGITERRFSQNTIAQLWYFVKCIYFGLSAYQIRCGYPTRILGNFLTKSYNYVNLFLFQGFRLIPFLTELRAVMDWVWTDTTLSLSSWICVEDIYAHIFILKCWRESEKRYPQPRGQKKKKVVKYGMGGMIVMLLICIVWFPLLFMSLIKSVAGVVNTPLDVSVTLTLGGLQNAMQFLESYVHEDLTVAVLEGSSNSLWTISPPSKQNLIKMLSETKDKFPLTFTWSIQRNLSLGAKAETAIGKHYIDLKHETRKQLMKLLSDDNQNGTEKAVLIEGIFPRYIRAPSDSNARPIEQLYKKEKEYMNIILSLHKSSTNSTEGVQEWWIVNQTEAGPLPVARDASNPGLEFYIFSDQVSPPSLGFLAGYGIMGLYMSVVLVIGKFVREFFSGISHTIMFEELPNVDRILKLCTDIFLVRETGELDLEEDLYAKLIFLYRSPETMIKWTREKSE
ncbi:piezo-type mechanosensitive ion channel component 2-like protein [Labeo rohita]|uniref:Piezo-type mechanosensitive ion channel component 2-like protein n=1 Tax=Labeo rohita TaxID=84645 RepID=A0A498N8C9_LABRO|nr:piezo-type mechanosensitive ion channel component 2-like protein [Labeo rohita]